MGRGSRDEYPVRHRELGSPPNPVPQVLPGALLTRKEGPGTTVTQCQERRVSLDPPSPAFLSRLSNDGTGKEEARTGPTQQQAMAVAALTLCFMSSIQSEPEGDGTALPSSDSLYSMRVFCARRESHGPSALGLHLCLKGTAAGAQVRDWNLPSEGTWGHSGRAGGWLLCLAAQSPVLKRER